MARVDEWFAEMYEELQTAAAGVGLTVTMREGYRTIAGQRRAVRRRGSFEAGGFAAAPGRSFHNYGLAGDVRVEPANWALFGRLAEELGFRWGGRFSNPEPWHIDLGLLFTIEEARDVFDRAFLRSVT